MSTPIELCAEYSMFETVRKLVFELGSKIITPTCIMYASANNDKTMLEFLLAQKNDIKLDGYFARKCISKITSLECLFLLLPYIQIDMKLLKRAVMVSNREISVFLKPFCVKNNRDIDSLKLVSTTYLNGDSIGILQELVYMRHNSVIVS